MIFPPNSSNRCSRHRAVKIAQADAGLIAANIAAQLRVASPDYDRIGFEVEPSGFDAAMRRGALR